MAAASPQGAGPPGVVVHPLPAAPSEPALTLSEALGIVRPLAHGHDEQAALAVIQGGAPLYSDGTSWTWLVGFVLPRRRATLTFTFDVHVEQDGPRGTAWPTVTQTLRPADDHGEIVLDPLRRGTLTSADLARLEAERLGLPRLPEPVTDSPALLAQFRALGADLADGSREPFLTAAVHEGVPVWRFRDCSDQEFELPMRPPV